MKYGYIILVLALSLLALCPPASLIACLWHGEWMLKTPWWIVTYIIGGVEMVIAFIFLVNDLMNYFDKNEGLTHHIITRAKAQLEELVKSAKGESQ